MNLKELLDDHQTGMSEFQDDFFVTTRAGGTLYGCYKQALRELYKRFRGLREETCDKAILQIEIEELAESPNKKDAVEHKRKSMQMEEATRSLANTQREFIRFYQQAIYLKKEIGDLTDERRSILDKEMWVFKIKEMALFDFIGGGQLKENTLSFLHCCPKEMKIKIIKEIQNADKLLEWYESKEEIIIPKKLPSVKFTMKLIEGF